jgi:hypothetical protein
MLRPLVLSLIVLLGSACKAPSVQSVSMPQLEVEAVSSAHARVYLMRRPQSLGRLRMLRGYDNGKLIGRIQQGRYLCWETSPGKRLIGAVYEARPIDGGDIEGLVDLRCEAGGVYYCAVELTRDEKGKPRLELLNAEEGRTLLADQSPARVDL